MRNKELDKILCDAYYEEIRQELSALPSDEELRREFPVTKEKRDKFIKRVYGKKKPVYISYLQRVAVFVLVFSAVSFGAMMLNPEIRAGMLEKGIKLFDKYIQFDFSEDKSDYTVDFDNIEIGYIPEGYKLSFSDISTENIRNIYYNDKLDCSISVNILTDLSDIDLRISDGFTDYDTITIDGFDGYSSYDLKNNSSFIIWGNSHFQICVTGEIELEEIKKIALDIKY